MNENSGSNFWANLRQILVLPKWAKVFLVALGAVAVAGLIAAFGLKAWAADKVDSGEIVLKGIDRGAQERILKAESAENSVVPSKFAYQNRLYFQRLDFLLRSKVIAYIDIQGISWAEGVDKNAVTNISSHNRWVKFATTQDLLSQGFADKNLGQVAYKMDFSPLIATILKYYLIITLGFILAIFAYRLLVLTERGEIKLTQNSLPSALWQGYKNINPLYRHTFWIVFVAMNLVFGFHTINFLWGDHDWGAAYYTYGIFADASLGRYTQNLIGLFLQNSMMLPILNNALAFAALALASVWLCMYINVPRKLYIWAIVGLLLALQPFTLARMYYAYQVSGLFIAVAIGVLGFILAKKAGEFSAAQPNSLSLSLSLFGKQNSTESAITQNSQSFANSSPNSAKNSQISSKFTPYALCALATLCIHWGIASYQPFIDTALILLCGGIIATLIDEKCSLKTAIYKSRFIIISVGLAAISYKIILDILKKLGKVVELYNNQMVPLSDLPKHIEFAFKSAFDTLFKLDISFMPSFMTWLFVGFVLVFFVLLFASKLKSNTKFYVLIFSCAAVLAAQTHNVLSLNQTNYDAILFYGLAFVRVLFVILAFKLCLEFIHAGFLVKNLLFVISCVLIWQCAVQDLHAQRTQKLAFDFELKMLNRVVDRLEQNENFDYKKKYCGLMFGDMPNLRARLDNAHSPAHALIERTLTYPPAPISTTLLNDVFTECAFHKISGKLEEILKNTKALSLIKRLDKAGILDELQPFPHKNSVVVFEDIIVFVASKGDLAKWQAEAKKWHEE